MCVISCYCMLYVLITQLCNIVCFNIHVKLFISGIERRMPAWMLSTGMCTSACPTLLLCTYIYIYIYTHTLIQTIIISSSIIPRRIQHLPAALRAGCQAVWLPGCPLSSTGWNTRAKRARAIWASLGQTRAGQHSTTPSPTSQASRSCGNPIRNKSKIAAAGTRWRTCQINENHTDKFWGVQGCGASGCGVSKY